jgi:hypothetical protein
MRTTWNPSELGLEALGGRAEDRPPTPPGWAPRDGRVHLPILA